MTHKIHKVKLNKDAVRDSALSAAYNVVFTTNDVLDNVIACGDPTDADLELKNKCEEYLAVKLR